MATNNPSSSFFIFHAGKILQINCATSLNNSNNSISQPEIYEIDSPKFSTIDSYDHGTTKRKIEETSCCASPSEWKKLKIYDRRNFIPLEIGFFMNQKDLFYEIISWLNVESILKSLRCVCKTWNNWIMIDFYELWKNRYEKMCNFEFNKDQLKNCQNSLSFLFNCHILESAMKKHAKFEDRVKLDLHFLRYEFSKDPVYSKIKKILQPRLFVLHVENNSKYIGREAVTDINITSLLNLGEYGFVKFHFKYFQFTPKNGEPFKNITVKYKLILNHSIVEGKEGSCHVLDSYDQYSEPVVKRNDELIVQIMSAIGIDRNLNTDFLMLVTFDFAFDYCGMDLYKSDYYFSLVGSEKFEQYN